MGRLIDADRLKDIIDYAILANVPADAENTKEEKWNDWIQTVIDRQPTVEAIPKDQYKARLRADMVAMLTELQLEIECCEKSDCDYVSSDCLSQWQIDILIQQKIDALKGEVDGQFK